MTDRTTRGASPQTDVTQKDVDALRRLWRFEAERSWQASSRTEGWCDGCTAPLHRGEGYLIGSWLYCEECVNEPDPLTTLRENRNFYGVGAVDKARQFVAEGGGRGQTSDTDQDKDEGSQHRGKETDTTTKAIREVHVYVTDISPLGLAGSPNVQVSVIMPRDLFPEADRMCGLDGALVEYVARHPTIKSRWVPKMSKEEFQNFSAREFPGREHRVCRLHTSDTAYTVVVVMEEK